MFDYIQKFNNLPKSIRERVSASGVVEKVERIEAEYGVNLAPVIMKVMIGDIELEKLEGYLADNFELGKEKARKLKGELMNRIFEQFADYLGLEKDNNKSGDTTQKNEESSTSFEEDIVSSAREDMEGLPKKSFYYNNFDPLSAQIDRKARIVADESNIIFSSSFLSNRFKNIIITYLKSVRNQANTLQALIKPVANGGAGLDKQEADKVLRIAKREKIDLEEAPEFYPSRLKYSSGNKGELAEYPEKNLVKNKDNEKKGGERDKDKEDSENRKEKSDFPKKKERGSENKEYQSEQEAQFDKYQQDRSYAKEAPGLDISLLGGERDIDYDLKSVLEHKYGNQSQIKKDETLNQVNREQEQAEKKKSDDKLKQSSSFVQNKPKKNKEHGGFFSKLLNFLTGKQSEQKEEIRGESQEIREREGKEEKERAGEQKKEERTRKKEEEVKKKKEKEEVRDERQKAREKEEEEKEKRKKEKQEKIRKEKLREEQKQKKEEQTRKEKEEVRDKRQETREKEKEEKEQNKQEKIRKKKLREEKEKEEKLKREEQKKKEKKEKERSSQEESSAEERKKKVEDIKPAPKVMSPIDELRYMDLVKFRRLGENAEEQTSKIKNKIDILGKESLEKKLKGIKAWREGLVNKTYLAMGQESMNKGLDIQGVINERKKKDKDYLTEEEFNFILDLNKKLRFY